MQILKPKIEINQFFFRNGTDTGGWSHYFYVKPFMYRIDCFYPHSNESIQEYKLKIDSNVSFYSSESLGLSEKTPYPQLDNGNIYDQLFHYSSFELDTKYIENQFYDIVLNNKYFDLWNSSNDYRPSQNIFGGRSWKLIVDVTIEEKKKHKEMIGYSSYPNGFIFFETLLHDFNNNSVQNPIRQNIKNPHYIEEIKKKSVLKTIIDIIKPRK
jgi:hypothetical protein